MASKEHKITSLSADSVGRIFRLGGCPKTDLKTLENSAQQEVKDRAVGQPQEPQNSSKITSSKPSMSKKKKMQHFKGLILVVTTLILLIFLVILAFTL